MHIFSLIQFLLLLLAAVGFFLLLRTLTIKHTLKGLRLIVVGFALVYLNIILDSLYHSNILPQQWNEVIFPRIEYVTGYFGLTLGMLLLLLGNYRLIRSLVPQLSERYSSLVEKALVGVYLIQDGVLKFVNERIAEIFGYKRDELFGKSILEFVSPESHATVIENIRKRVDENDDALNYTFVGRKKGRNQNTCGGVRLSHRLQREAGHPWYAPGYYRPQACRRNIARVGIAIPHCRREPR